MILGNIVESEPVAWPFNRDFFAVNDIYYLHFDKVWEIDVATDGKIIDFDGKNKFVDNVNLPPHLQLHAGPKSALALKKNGNF